MQMDDLDVATGGRLGGLVQRRHTHLRQASTLGGAFSAPGTPTHGSNAFDPGELAAHSPGSLDTIAEGSGKTSPVYWAEKISDTMDVTHSDLSELHALISSQVEKDSHTTWQRNFFANVGLESIGKLLLRASGYMDGTKDERMISMTLTILELLLSDQFSLQEAFSTQG